MSKWNQTLCREKKYQFSLNYVKLKTYVTFAKYGLKRRSGYQKERR